MTDSEALEMTQAAVKAALDKVGNDRQAMLQEMGRKSEEDPKLREAMVIGSFLLLQSQQGVKH